MSIISDDELDFEDPFEDAGDYYDNLFGGILLECPRGHEYDPAKDDVCPQCIDDADNWIDGQRDA